MTSGADILQQLANEEEASQFLEMVVDTGLNETLSASGPFTVFVPVNQARTHELEDCYHLHSFLCKHKYILQSFGSLMANFFSEIQVMSKPLDSRKTKKTKN